MAKEELQRLNTSKSFMTILDGLIELKVPLAIGTLQWGTTPLDNYFINARGVLPEATCREIVAIVSSKNVTLFDTAEGYGGGTSEKRLGRLLDSSHILMTKFLPAPWRCFQNDFERAVRQSCQRLNVSCIPVYLLHSPVHWRPIEYWIEAGAICKRKGLIHSMGLSNCNADQVRRAVAAGKQYDVPVVCNQVHFSLLDYNSQSLRDMEETCRELGLTVIGFTPLGQGLLTETLTDERFKTNRAAKMLRIQQGDIRTLRAAISEMAVKYQKSMAQISLNWCIQHNVVPLVGCRSPI